MATPIFISSSSASSSGNLSSYAKKTDLTTAVSSLNGSINSATTDTAVNQKLLTGYTTSTGTISSSDSIVSAIGKLAGTTAITANSVESIGSTLNIGSWNATQVLNLASGTGVQTVNIGNGVGATAINLGGGSDTVSVAGSPDGVSGTSS